MTTATIKLIQDAVNCRVQFIGSPDYRVDQLLIKSLGYRTAEAYLPSLGRTVGGQWVTAYKRQTRSFPRGFAKDAAALLMSHGYAVVGVNETRSFTHPSATFEVKQAKTLRWYQEEAIKAIQEKRYGFIELPTGAGKTLVIEETIACIKPHGTLVVTKGKKLVGDLAKTLGQTFPSIQIQQWGGVNVPKRFKQAVDPSKPYIIVSTYQSFTKANHRDPLIREADMVLADESHVCVAETFAITVQATPAPYVRIGFTATPFREGEDAILLKGYVGDVLYKVNQDVLADEGYLAKAEVQTINLDKLTEAELLQRLQGRKTLIITELVSTAEALQEMFPSIDVLTGQTSTKKLTERFNRFVEAKSDVLICTSIFDEGVDVPSIDTIIHYRSFNSLNKLIQRNGRALRPLNEKVAWLIHNVDTRDERACYRRMKVEWYQQSPSTYTYQS